MKYLILIILFISCYIEPTPFPRPIPPPVIVIGPTPYCGDGICDEWDGEDEWWCMDCGYDVMLGGPSDGGYCGDGICFGFEDEWSCWKDCVPEPYKGQKRWDRGYIDPRPEM